MTDLKKSIVLTAAMTAPLLLPAPALANDQNTVNPLAVSQFTNSVKETLAAYDFLEQGNVTAAQSKLTQALRDLESAMAKDPSLSLSQKSGQALYNDLKIVKTKLNSNDSFQAKSEFASVLSSAGIIS